MPEKQPIMPPEEERYMAFCASIQWADAVVEQKKEILRLRSAMPTGLTSVNGLPTWVINQRNQTSAHFFSVAVNQMKKYFDWSRKFGDFKQVDTAKFYKLRWAEITDARDMREHGKEYFDGRGQYPDRWIKDNCDASAINGDYIGGRLNFQEVGKIVEDMLSSMLAKPTPFPPTKFSVKL